MFGLTSILSAHSIFAHHVSLGKEGAVSFMVTSYKLMNGQHGSFPGGCARSGVPTVFFCKLNSGGWFWLVVFLDSNRDAPK